MSKVKHLLETTKDLFNVRWRVSELRVPGWVINAVVWIMAIRGLSYGIELITLVNNPISPLLAFAAVSFSLEVWGILLLIGVVILVLGLVLKRSIFVTIGSLVCLSVWGAFALSLGIGFYVLGTGGRFFVSAALNAAMHGLLFHVQLRNISKNGV